MKKGDKYLRKCESKYAVIDEVKEDAGLVFFDCYILNSGHRLYSDYLTIPSFIYFYPNKMSGNAFHKQKSNLKV